MRPVDWLPELVAYPLYWITTHQTLVVGAFAVFVAGRTIVAIRDQISSETKSREEQRARELLSLKAGATVSISVVFQYAEDCIKYCKSFLRLDGALNGELIYDVDADFQNPYRGNLPEYPASAFEVLQELIKYADPADGAALHEILAFSQAHRSGLQRTANVLEGVDDSGLQLTSTDIYYEIRDAVGLRQHMVRLFGWSRGTDERIVALCDEREAVSALEWIGLGSRQLRQYILEHWPPRSPSKSSFEDTC